MVDSWFHSWHPPSSLVTGQHPLDGQGSNFSIFGAGYSLSQNHPVNHHPGNYLPLLFSLSFVNPKDKKYDDHNDVDSIEKTGPFKTVYYWSELDFDYPTENEREIAIISKEFVPKNNLPLGIEIYQDRIFVSMPKWKPGVPATLTVIPKEPRESSPKLLPYPNWAWHTANSCDGIVSVFRMQADSCGRLWVLDSGQIHITIKPKQVCPPKLLIFDLDTDKLVRRYVFPEKFIKQDSLYSNIIVDVRDDCENVHAYLTDVWRYGLVVYSFKKHRAWRVTDHLFFPEPLASAYKVHHLEFEWMDGIFGMSLSPYDNYYPDRTLYFHPMSSFREFYVKTSVICNETGWADVKGAFKVLGQSRGKSGHVSASWMDRKGIMFYNMVTRDTIGCWDTRKPYKRSNHGVVAHDSETMVFPNDMKVDQEEKQKVWVITNKLPFYLYEGLKKEAINFRILAADTDEAVKGTICDPDVSTYDTYREYVEDEDCY